LEARLEESLRSGLLFGNADEPLDAYGKRIVRVIQSALLAVSSGGAGEACSLDDACACLACVRERSYLVPHGTLKLTRYGRAAYEAGRKAGGAGEAQPCQSCEAAWKMIDQCYTLEPDAICEHGTAMDVHCCNCHGGFLFDSDACTCLSAPAQDAQTGSAQELLKSQVEVQQP
jgi:hypothetical protein